MFVQDSYSTLPSPREMEVPHFQADVRWLKPLSAPSNDDQSSAITGPPFRT